MSVEAAEINPEERQPASYLVKEFEYQHMGVAEEKNEDPVKENARVYMKWALLMNETDAINSYTLKLFNKDV